jgi:hypothetical protein
MAAPWRLFWLVVLGFHAVAASAWWWLMPGGFPAWHPRFWTNGVAPLVVLAAVVLAIMAARRERLSVLSRALVAFPACWVAGAIAGRAAFPITLQRLFAAPLACGVAMGLVWWLTFRRQLAGETGRSRRSLWTVVVTSAAFGATFPFLIRAPAAETRPTDMAFPEVAGGSTRLEGGISRRVFVHGGDGSVTVKAGGLNLSIQPLQAFISRSPDGCQTILAPVALREGPSRRLISAERVEGGLSALYREDFDALLRIEPDDGAGPIRLEALASLPRRIDSHLNSFCDVEVSGHKRLALSFSPCPEHRIEVLPADYPVGRPIRLAYLDDATGFHVVEASNSEKGPFREMAGGRLKRGEALTITFHDEGKPVASVTLDDWSAQVGTALSPTAGWGLPVNAIEFSRAGNEPNAMAGIYITLASTSVGRGWDSVGHNPGVYRNRLRIEDLRQSQPAER